MNISFRRLILISVLMALLGVGLVYGIRYEFQPRNSRQTPTIVQSPDLPVPVTSDLLVFAYSSDAGGFVQASVTITGPELNGTTIQIPTNPTPNSTAYVTISEESFNGTTTTDLQNPLTFNGYPGLYSVSGTYDSAPPQNMTVNMTELGFSEVVFNFGSSPPPPLGHLFVCAFNSVMQPDGSVTGGFVQASVNITGPESLNATIRDSQVNPSVFTIVPGVYTVVATYGSAALQSETANVTAGSFAGAFFWFGSNSPPY